MSAEAQDVGERSAEIWALNELATVFKLTDRVSESVTTAYRAFELACDSGDRQDALSMLGSLLANEGQYDAAEDAFNLVLREERSPKKRMYILMDLLRLAGLRKNRLGFERLRAECQALEQEASLLQVRDLEVTVAIAYARLGIIEMAAAHLDEAVRLTQECDLKAYAGPDSSALSDLSTIVPLHDGDETLPPRQSHLPAFPEVAEQLRALLLAG